MAYTFDAVNRLVRCSADTAEIRLADLWSRWKDWVLAGNASAARAFDTVGGDIAAIPLYLFPVNGWKIKLPEASITVRVVGGVLATADGSDPFSNPDGAFTVRIEREAPGLAIGYSTTGGAGGATAAEVWSYGSRTLTGVADANIRQVNNVPITGAGVAGSNPWRPA